MPQENINLSEMTINGVIFTLKDNAAQNDIQNIASAIVTNNISISERINNLNERSFDSLIKISSNNDSEISNISDGLYKIQYVTIETVEEETVETVNNIAILFQKGINQYLIKDGSILNRTKTNDTWNEWQSQEISTVLSANYEMSSDSNNDLTLEAGDTYEEAFAKIEKTINDNEIVIATSLTDLDSKINNIPTYDSSHKLSADLIEDGITNKVINVKPDWEAASGSAAEILNKPDLSNFLTIETQANWNETNTSSAAYIQNKPTIPAAQIQADWNQTTNTALDYIKNKPNITVISNPNGDTNISSNGTLNIKPSFNPGDINIETFFGLGDVNITGGNKLNLSSGDDEININSADDINLTTSNNCKVYYNNKEVATKNDIPTVPTTSTTVTQNDNNPVSGGAVYNKFADLIGTAPAALDTLGEIAAALNNDADLAGTLTTQISSKVPKVSNPTTNNFASFNSDGTIKDSGHSHSDYITSIKTVNNESLVGTGNIVISGLPQVSASDNGKILMVVNGQWALVSPSTLYSGNGVPNKANGNNGDLFMQTD